MTDKHTLLLEGLAAELGIDDHLINFKQDFIDTRWRYNGYSWSAMDKSPTLNLPKSLPSVRDYCHCTTPIKINCLIQHKDSKQYVIVGNVCIRKLGVRMIRTCIDCNQANRTRTLRCIDCRIKCVVHNTYHDNNDNCNYLTVRANAYINFGKYSKYTYAQVKDIDRSYLDWMGKSIHSKAWVLEYMKLD